MADDITITPGIGATVGADLVSSVYYQRVKVVWGPDGTVNDTDVASGKPMPVQLRDASGNAIAFNANAQATAANSAPVVQASDRQNSVSMTVDMTVDTSAYASADLLADTQQFNGFFNKSDGSGVINSITLYDYADNTAFACYVLFHKTTTSMGTESGAPNISDANARDGIFGYVAVATTDWLDIGGLKIATVKNIGLPVSAVSGTDDLYCSIVNGSSVVTFAGGTIGLTVGGLLD